MQEAQVAAHTLTMSAVSLPRWTKPWKVVAIAMAIFGFVNGYVGTAGAPYCGSMGQCLQRVVDAGPPWFYPAALIPGAIGATLLAAVVYVLFLAVHGVRKVFHRTPVASEGRAQSTQPTPAVRDGQPAQRDHDASATRWLRDPRSAALAVSIAVGVLVAWRPDDQFAGLVDYFDDSTYYIESIRNTWQFRPEAIMPGIGAAVIAFLLIAGLRVAWHSYAPGTTTDRPGGTPGSS